MIRPTFSTTWPDVRKWIVLAMVHAIAYMPLVTSFAMSESAKALNATATRQATTKDDVAQRCTTLGESLSPEDSGTYSAYDSALASDDQSLSEADRALVAGDLANFEADPYAAMTYVTPADISPLYPDDTAQQLAAIGSSQGNGWWVCKFDAQRLLSPIPISGKLNVVLNAAANASAKITFSNPLDYYAVNGENCTKLNGSVCSEMKAKTDSAGNKTYRDDPNCKLTAKSGWVPVYYQDEGWENDCWDAPKADSRILKSLNYLITPKDQGGAGHETINVAKVTQVSGKEKEFNDLAPRIECGAGDYSSHHYEALPPHGNICVAKSVEIDKIDNIRVTTKITQKKRIGGSTVSYNYQQFPIKVAWQTDDGVTKSGGLPSNTLFQGALSAFQGGLSQFLSNLDLEPTVDLSGIDLNNFNDVLKLAGSSLLGNLFNSPTGALKGSDLPSTLDSFGKDFLTQQMGLVPGSLASQGGDLTDNVGQATLENMLGLPNGSLSGTSTDQILTNLGRRFLEEQVFKVTPGTLNPSAGFPIANAADMAKVIGIGKIEKTYNLAPQSLRVNNLDTLRSSSQAAKGIFSSSNADRVDQDLYLGYVNQSGSASTFGVPTTASDYDRPTAKLLNGATSLGDYFSLVGTRSIQGGIGSFTATSTGADATEPLQTFSFLGQTVPVTTNINGLSCTTVLSQFKDSNPFDVCNSNNLQSILGANNKDGLQSLVDAGVFTQAKANDLYARISQLTAGNSFHLSPAQAQADRINTLKNLYNQIADSSANGWQTIFQGAQQQLADAKATGLTDDEYHTLPRTQLAEDTLNQVVSQLNAFSEGILDYFDKIGQGGMGAGLYLTSTKVTFNPDGQIVSVTPGTVDPIQAILKGNLGNLRQIGSQVAARSLTTEKIAQHNLFNQVNSDGSANHNDFNSTGTSAQLGTNPMLVDQDLERIFYRNDSSFVFDRIGSVELLKTLWQRNDLPLRPDQLQKLTSANGTPQPTVAPAPDSFFTQRLSQLKSLTGSLLQSGGLQGSTTDLAKFKSQPSPSDPDVIKDVANNLESALSSVKPNNSGGQQSLAQAKRIIQELTVGRSLETPSTPLTNAGQVSLSTGNTQGEFSCSSTSTLEQIVRTDRTSYVPLDSTRSAATAAQITKYTQNVADCQLSDSLGLPAGTFTTWLSSSDITPAGLATAIGRAQAIENNQPINDADAKNEGAKVLGQLTASFLSSSIPGYSSFDSRYNLNEQDLVNLFIGNSTPTLTKIGGKNLDERSNWSSGTSLNMVDPTCKTGETVRPCTSDEANSIRLNSIAQVGLQKVVSDLGMPAGFDITGSGSFNEKYSNALFSNALGLKKNTFSGSFTDVMSKNDPGAILIGLGMGDTNAVQAALILQTAIGSRIAGNPTLANPELDGAIIDYVSKARQAVLKQVQDGNGPYWKTADNNSVQPLIQADNAAYKAFTQTLSKMNGAAGFSDLINKSLANLSSDPATYVSLVNGLQTRSTSLDQQLKVGDGSIKKFVTGGIKAEDMAKPATQGQLIEILAKNLPESAQGLFNVVKQVTGCDLYQYLEGGKPNKDCKLSDGVGNMKDLLNDPTARQALYEGLAQVWGSSLETQFQLPKGTIMNLAMNPSDAPEIILSQGLQKIAGQIFKVEADDSDLTKSLKGAFGNAFLALTCNPETRICGLDFNTVGAREALQKSLNAMMDNEIATLGKENAGNKTITRVDLQAVLSGDLKSLIYVGIQELIGTINKGVTTGGAATGGTAPVGATPPISPSDPHLLNFQSVRHSLGKGKFSTQKLKDIGEKAALDYLAKKYPSSKCLTAADKSDCLEKLGKDSLEGIAISMIAKIGKSDYIRNQNQASQADLQYAVLTTLLFSKDKNVPVGFVKTMETGSNAQRLSMIAQYGLNAGLRDGLGGILNQEEIGLLEKFVKNDFKDAKQFLQDVQVSALSQVFGKIDAWLTGTLEKAIGVKLTPQFMQAFGEWAGSGFSKDVFSNGTGGVDPTTGKPLPTLKSMVQDIGAQKLFALGDNLLGFQAGTTQKIYEAYKAVRAVTSNATAAQKANATAYLVSLAITNIASAQLRSIETALGLVPGSMDLLVQAAVYSIFFPPAAPVFLLQFVLVNLFGVYKVTIEVRATSDGYWPLGGPHPPEYSLANSDLALGDFDAKQTATYQAGIRQAAQQKVHGFLDDLTKMPERWGGITLTPPKKMWISQVFTHPAGDLGSLDGQLSANAPWDSPPGMGYGSLANRTDGKDPQSKDGYYYYTPLPGYRSGFFPDSTFWNQVHIRW